MPNFLRGSGSNARTVTALALALLIAGGAAFLLPPLLRKQRPVAETAAPPPLFASGEFTLAPGQQACMESVALVPHGDLAQLQLPDAPATPAAPPIELVLTGPGYVGRAHLPAGHPGGRILLTFTPPKHSELGIACVVNRGRTAVVLIGSKEARSFPRSQLVIAGTPLVGEISLAFYDSHERSLLGRVGATFSHASNLTDRLIPVWLIWIVAVLFALGVPAAMLAALYFSLWEDEATSAA